MLSRANNVSIRFEPVRYVKPTGLAWLLRLGRKEVVPVPMGRGWLRIGRKKLPGAMVTEEEYLKEEQQQRREPILMAVIDGRQLWWFQDRFYWDNDYMDGDDVHALLLTRHQRERQRIDRARAMVAMGEEPRIRERAHTGRRQTTRLDTRSR